MGFYFHLAETYRSRIAMTLCCRPHEGERSGLYRFRARLNIVFVTKYTSLEILKSRRKSIGPALEIGHLHNTRSVSIYVYIVRNSANSIKTLAVFSASFSSCLNPI